MIIFLILICMIISLLLLFINYYISSYTSILWKINLTKNVYECGFNPYIIDRRSFPRFYIVAILFLLFDLEVFFILISICLPYIFILKYSMTIYIILIFILLLGMFIEWWSNIISKAGFHTNYTILPIIKPFINYYY